MHELRRFERLPRSVLKELDDEALEEFKDFGPATFSIGALGGWVLTRDDKPVFYCGIKPYSTITNRYELWWMMCKEYKRGLKENLRVTAMLVTMLAKVFPGLISRTSIGSKGTEAFAKSMGFEEIRRSDEFIFYRMT